MDRLDHTSLYLRFPQFVHHIVIDEEMIILDERKDRYFFLTETQTAKFLTLCRGEIDSDAIAPLYKKGLVSYGCSPQIINYSNSKQIGIDRLTWGFQYKYARHNGRSIKRNI